MQMVLFNETFSLHRKKSIQAKKKPYCTQEKFESYSEIFV